jgi:hypothetical protein
VLEIASLCAPKASPASSPPPPVGKLKFNALGLTVRLDVPADVTVSVTLTLCGLPVAPVAVIVTVPL